MRLACLFLLHTISHVIFAQRSDRQIIEDSVIGWQYKVTGLEKPKPTVYLGRTFTTKQQELLNTITGWVQKSYIPVAGLGTFRNMIYVDEKAFNPHSYGIDFRVWNVSFKPEYLDAKKNFKPVQGEYWDWAVSVNSIPASFPIYYINTPNQYLFTWQPDGYMKSEDLRVLQSKADPKITHNAYKFITRINNTLSVFLAPDNKIPFSTVSKEEFLNLSEQSLDRYLQNEKDRIKTQWPGADERDKKTRDEVFTISKEKMEKFRKVINELRIKHKATLHEPAILRNMQPTMDDFNGITDPLELRQNQKQLNDYFPVYKILPEIIAKCNSDQPQWIAINFPFRTKEDGNQKYELYRAMTQHFNYEYVYDYFFNPEKVKGKPYKPVNEELQIATLNNYRKNSSTKIPTPTFPAGIHYMDDFSTNEINTKPAGWYSSLSGSGGGSCIVTTNKDFPGKWVEFGKSNMLISNAIKYPLPENFTLEFEVATSDFKGRTGGNITLILEDKKNGTEIKFNLTPANDQYMGSYASSANLSIQLPRNIKYDAIRTEMELTDFSSKKRKAHITIKKTGRQLLVFINGKQMPYLDVYKKDKSQEMLLAPGTQFNSISWRNQTSDPDAKAYLSNIKITKN